RHGEPELPPLIPRGLRRDRLGAGRQHVAAAATGEPLAIAGVVHPLVAVVIAKHRDLGELPLEDARAASARRHRAEAEEAHAGGAFALELAIEVIPQALSARGCQARDREILQHRLLVSLDDIRRQLGLAAVLGLQKARFVAEDVAARDARDAGGTAAGVAIDPRLGHLVETELLDRLAI